MKLHLLRKLVLSLSPGGAFDSSLRKGKAARLLNGLAVGMLVAAMLLAGFLNAMVAKLKGKRE